MCPEQIISGSGTQFPLIVNADGTIGVNITGSIMIGSVSAQVDSIYVQSGTMYLSSGNVTMESSAGSVGVYGSVYTTGSIVTAGSTSLYGTGSIRIAEQGVNLQVYNSGLFSIVGSITSMPDINTGSESWIKGGSIQTYSSLGSIGTYGSIYATGSVNISTPVSLAGSVGVYGSAYMIGSINQNTDPWRITGSVTNYGIGSILMTGSIASYGSVYSTGSINISTPVSLVGSVGAYGSIYVTGSIEILTNSVKVAGSIYTTGSINIVGGSIALYGIGSVLLISTAGSIPIFGSIYSIGSINIVTSPVPISGTATIAGSAYVTGSVNIVGGSIALYGIGSQLLTSTAGSIGVYSPALEDFTLRYIQTIAYTGLSMGSVIEYIGTASPGESKTGSFTWQIRKYTYDSNGWMTDTQFADGNTNFDNSWAARGTGTYA